MTDTTDDLAHLDARIDLIREQRDAMERIAAERAVASDRNLARWTSATDALHKATADLNATRQKLTTAEALRDSLQAAADLARSERNAAIANRDGLLVERDAVARERDRLRGYCDAYDSRLTAVRAELTAAGVTDSDGTHALNEVGRVKILAAEVAVLRARPVLTDERLAAALTVAGLPAGHAAWVMAALGAVTLPTPDRLATLEAHLRDMHKGADDGEAQEAWLYCAELVSAEIRALGAPATTPSKPAEEIDHEQRAALKPGVGYWPPCSMNGVEAVVMGAMLTASGPVAISDATLLAMARGAIESVDALNAPPPTAPPSVVVESADGAIAVQPHRSEP